jgi:hypothetical protein
MRRTFFLLNPNSVRPPLELHGLLVRYSTDGSSFGHSLSHLIVSWIAITTAHVTTEVLIITKSGIEVDLADLPWPLTFDGRDRRVRHILRKCVLGVSTCAFREQGVTDRYRTVLRGQRFVYQERRRRIDPSGELTRKLKDTRYPNRDHDSDGRQA